MPRIRAVSLISTIAAVSPLCNPGIPHLLNRVQNFTNFSWIGPVHAAGVQVDMTEYSKLSDLVLTQSLAVLAAGLELGLLCVVCTN